MVIIILTGLMINQIVELIETYLKEETINRMSILTRKTLPNIIIRVQLYSPIIFKKILPQIYNQIIPIIQNKEMNLKEKEMLFAQTYSQFFISLFNQNNYKKLHQYFEYKNLIKACKIKINNEVISCPEPNLKISFADKIIFSLDNYFFGNMNNSYRKLLIHKNIEHNLQKVTFELTPSYQFFLVNFNSMIDKDYSQFLLESNKEINLFYYSYSVKKLKRNQFLCNRSNENLETFSSFDLNNCRINCKIDRIISKYGCLIISQNLTIIDFNQHLKSKSYKFCNKSLEINETFLSDNTICDQKCIDKCDSLYYEMILKYNHFQNSTKLNLIPIDFPHMIFSETLKSDFNQLIYNFGGIIILWFWLLSISAVKLVPTLSYIYIKSKPILEKFLLFFLRILVKNQSFENRDMI